MLFDFNTTHGGPLDIRINGTSYSIPRFLTRQFAAWAQKERQRLLDEALSQIADEKERAQFILYFSAPAVDVYQQVRELNTARGVEVVVRDCLSRGGVPADVIEKVIVSADPIVLRQLAGELCSSAAAEDAAAQISGPNPPEGEGNDPLPSSQAKSGALPATGASSAPASTPATAA